MPEVSFEHLFSIRCALAKPPEPIGPTPEGLRVNFYFLGGEITGPRLQGKVRPSGSDWFLVRRDGVGFIDVRATFESHDGAVILASHSGVVDLGENGYEDSLARKLGPHATARVAARYQTAHPEYLWMNRIQCFATLDIDRAAFQLAYEVFALR
jgi:hypothetical protein